ncbi:MAG: response regulator transcription factor [Anaerolineaceae bacterium]|nr:response regulator transcription factor [Anaerolineaceae bacterium]
MNKIRVFIVDDHPVVRKGIHGLLCEYPNIEVVGESDGSPGVLDLCDQFSPDIVLLDIELPFCNGLTLCQTWRQSRPDLRIVILTSYDEETYILEALRFGAHGYLMKSSSPEILVDTLQAVQAGERRISTNFMTTVLRSIEQSKSERIQATGVSEEELSFLQLIADGATNRNIAEELYISERTVKRKLQELLSKLGAKTRAQAVAKAYKQNIL